MATTMHGVSEYVERYPVELDRTEFLEMTKPFESSGRWIIRAYNEGRHNCTEVDLIELIEWLRENLPECLEPPRKISNA